MSGGESDADDADTGPLHVSNPSSYVDDSWDRGGETNALPEDGLAGDARLYTPHDSTWQRRFEPLTVNPRPVRREPKPVVLLGAVALVLVVSVGGLAFWQLGSSPSPPSAQSTDSATPSTPASPDPEAQSQLLRLLPAGYPSDSCTPVAPPEGAVAQVNCARNIDAGGPLSSTYTLVRDMAALDAAFNNTVAASTQVNCPGNIQSPGPWRRNATPEKISGVLFCGIQDGKPTVAWTDEARLMASVIQSGPQGPTFDQLYTWWSSHS